MSQSSGKVKAGQLWSKNKEDLTKQLGELKTELGQLKIQKIASSGTKLNKMYVFDRRNGTLLLENGEVLEYKQQHVCAVRQQASC
jgi:glucose dehydrogenase